MAKYFLFYFLFTIKIRILPFVNFVLRKKKVDYCRMFTISIINAGT